MDSAYKVDEGYSEETRSQEGIDSPMHMEAEDGHALLDHFSIGSGLQDAILALGENERKELAYSILRSLRVSSMASVVDQIWPLFHKDPVTYFPLEIVSQIFSYLEPRNLMNASRASRTWRARVLDSRLWKEKFKTEGWGLNVEEIDRFERRYNMLEPGTEQAALQALGYTNPQDTKGVDTIDLHNASQINAPDSSISPNVAPSQPTSGLGEDEEMPDVSAGPSISQSPSTGFGLSHNSAKSQSNLSPDTSSKPSTRDDSKKGESLMLYAAPGNSRLNYHYIFKQKRKLEDNWHAGRYRNFQLPHKDHPEDAHTECVYTIQYLGRHLVSGSRDRTLRIWDLDTLRLARPPLHGHLGSVLCLQFDDHEDEDIIISGSSDCHVIVWRFSTGQQLKQLTNAHKESVLNLRFDKRFLVTCSKDKTIKIWNRHDLTPGDRDYPVKGIKGGGNCPAYIIDSASVPDALRLGPSNPEHRMRLEEYTHIMTLDLHVAAVNAIQIFEDQLVSASGDRCLRVWDIHSGECTTKIEAHQKGIACVQYDGKRIVSGSSDNSIRIWDPVTNVEVARLEGHHRLVRTIQAAFVDTPGGRDRLGAEAAEIERQYHMAYKAGEFPQRSLRDPPPKPGSRKLKDLRAVNTRLPPSGGGSRWSHIVSGSYDETVIVWRKTKDDEWEIGHILRQEEALTAAGPKLVSQSEQIQDNRMLMSQFGTPRHPPAGTPATALAGATGILGPNYGHQHQGGSQVVGGAPIENAPNSHPTALTDDRTNSSTSQVRPQQFIPPDQNDSSNLHPPSQANEPNMGTHRHAVGSIRHPYPTQPVRLPANTNHANVHAGGHSFLPRPNPNYLQQNLPGGRLANPGAAGQAINGGNNFTGQPNARVFKLQFDARRIICCSQDPKIVGWDFANNDPQILECSRFFAAPQ